MRRYVACLAASLAAVLIFSVSAAAKPAVAVLRIDGVLTGGKSDAKTAVVANKLTTAIRGATHERGPYRLAPNTNKDLLELKLGFSCGSEAPACMAKIGRSLRSHRLLWGKVAYKGDHYLVTVNLLNVRARKMMRSTTVRIPTKDATSAGLSRWGRTLYGRLTGTEDHGGVHIEANASSGVVLIDGNPATNLKNGKADVAGLSAGAHELEIKAEGFQPYSETISVEGGKKSTVHANLTSKATPIIVKKGGTQTQGKPGGMSRMLFWTTGTIAVLAGVGATVTGLQVIGSLKDDKEEEIRKLRAATGIELDTNNACADAEARGSVAQGVIDVCNTGKSRATLSNVLTGIGIASAAAAVFFYIRGYGSSGGSRESATQVGKTRHIRITPTVGAGHVGGTISLEF